MSDALTLQPLAARLPFQQTGWQILPPLFGERPSPRSCVESAEQVEHTRKGNRGSLAKAFDSLGTDETIAKIPMVSFGWV